MSIFAISDLHLSFNSNKPMDVFGWNNYEEKIEKDWQEKVSQSDLVVIPGDFSWEMKLEDTYKDFCFINNLPGKKLLLKGNHDYWWETLTNMKKYLETNNLKDIEFLHNNSYEYENTIIAGTRGWNLYDTEKNDPKIRNREALRLEMSIQDGIKKYGENKEIIVFMHYPPITINNPNTIYSEILQKYNIKKCIYGHLHGDSQKEAINGKVNNIEYIMASCDYTNFKLIKIQ